MRRRSRLQVLDDPERLGRLTLYTSDQAHSAVLRAAWIAGVPRRNVRVLATDERFVDRTQLSRHQEELYGEIAAIAPTRTTDDWAALCAEHSIPFAPVLDLETAHEDPYVVDGGLLTEQEHPTEGPYRSIGFPVRFSETPAGMRTPTPRQGADTADVLRELGRTEEQIEAMTAGDAAQRSSTGGAR